MRILVVNGPNLNLLGQRETNVYGSVTLKEIEARLKAIAQPYQMEIHFFQSNHEGAIVDFIQDEADKAEFLIINPAALTHTSIAIRDAILAKKISTLEIHLSNIYKRETFRQVSYIRDIAEGIFVGLGPLGYELALEYIIKKTQNTNHDIKT